MFRVQFQLSFSALASACEREHVTRACDKKFLEMEGPGREKDKQISCYPELCTVVKYRSLGERFLDLNL